MEITQFSSYKNDFTLLQYYSTHARSIFSFTLGKALVQFLNALSDIKRKVRDGTNLRKCYSENRHS